MPQWIKAHCSSLTICLAPCHSVCVFAQALIGNYPPYIMADCLSTSHYSISLVNILDICLQWLKCRCWIIAMERQGQRIKKFLGIFGWGWGWKKFGLALPEFADTRAAQGSKELLFPLAWCWRMLSTDWSRAQTHSQTGNVCPLETSAVLLCFSYYLPKYTSCTFPAQNSLLWGLIHDM